MIDNTKECEVCFGTGSVRLLDRNGNGYSTVCQACKGWGTVPLANLLDQCGSLKREAAARAEQGDDE